MDIVHMHSGARSCMCLHEFHSVYMLKARTAIEAQINGISIMQEHEFNLEQIHIIFRFAPICLTI